MKTISLKQLHKIALGLVAAAVLGLGFAGAHPAATSAAHSAVPTVRLLADSGQESHGGGGKGGHLMPRPVGMYRLA